MTLGQFKIYAAICGLFGGGGGNPTRQSIMSAPSGVDDTVALQAIVNAIIGNPGKGLYIPDGHYKISDSIKLGTLDTDVITGVRIHGESRGGVIIEQKTNGKPIFQTHAQFFHSAHFETMSLTYTNAQAAGSGANVFQCDGPAGGSFYNSTFKDITADKFDYFCNAPTVTWWGNAFRDLWLGNFASGLTNVQAAAGEPRCTFENLYITGERATQPLFTNKSMTAWYNNIEVNNVVNGVKMLFDNAGGNHVIGHWALEGASFAAAATQQLFDVQNSRLLAQYIYLTSLTLGAGATVYAFHAETGTSTAQIEQLDISFAANAGQFYVFNAQGPLPCRLGDVKGLSATCSLGDSGGSACLNFVSVDRWNNPANVAFLADADATLTYDAPMTQVLDIAITAIRTVKLPQGTSAASTLNFTGRRFRFIKTTTSANNLIIADSAGTAICTIPGGAKGCVELFWKRSGGAANWTWTIASQPLVNT
jgi:hypothetical protein